MEIWKPLSKFRYSDERNEYKYHTDFALGEGETIVVYVNGKLLLEDKVSEGEKKYHFEMAVESFAEKPDEVINGVPIYKIRIGKTD